MARGGRKRRGGATRWLSATGLLCFGAVIGVLLGAILDGPRMLVRRWTEEVQVLELPTPKIESPTLDEFNALQAKTAPSPSLPPAPTPQKQADPSQPVASAPTRSASPEKLIAEIRQRKAEPVALPTSPPEAQPETPPEVRSVPTSAGRSGPVVQVAAFRDASAAETLVQRLRRAGYDAYLSDQRADGSNKYRVRVQPPPGGSVKKLAKTLEERGYGVWVTSE